MESRKLRRVSPNRSRLAIAASVITVLGALGIANQVRNHGAEVFKETETSLDTPSPSSVGSSNDRSTTIHSIDPTTTQAETIGSTELQPDQEPVQPPVYDPRVELGNCESDDANGQYTYIDNSVTDAEKTRRQIVAEELLRTGIPEVCINAALAFDNASVPESPSDGGIGNPDEFTDTMELPKAYIVTDNGVKFGYKAVI